MGSTLWGHKQLDTTELLSMHSYFIMWYNKLNELCVCVCVCVCVRVCVCACVYTQSCRTLFDSMDCGPLVSSVHGMSQARILEWAAVSSFRASYQLRD